MVVLRVLAWIFLIVATVAFISDLTRSSTTGGMVVTSTLIHWKTFAPQSLAAFTSFVQRTLHPLVWDPVLVRLLILPAWVAIGALGLTCAVLGRKKRRVNIFAN